LHIAFLVSAYVAITVAAFSQSGCAENEKIVGFSQTENIGPWRIAETNSIRTKRKA